MSPNKFNSIALSKANVVVKRPKFRNQLLKIKDKGRGVCRG
jgi:hypothetical protein